jgi:hypothetical protein
MPLRPAEVGVLRKSAQTDKPTPAILTQRWN